MQPRPKTAGVEIRSSPAGASVFRVRDGRFMGKTPVPLGEPFAGEEIFELRLDGYRNTRVTVTPGGTTPVIVTLARPPPDVARPDPRNGGAAGVNEPRGRPRGRGRPPRIRPRPPAAGSEWDVVDPFKGGRPGKKGR